MAHPPTPEAAPEPQSALHVPSNPAAAMSARPVGFSSTQASVLLDVVRGLAATLVMIGHWRALFFVDYAQIPRHRSWFAVPYVLTSAGHQAVVIFFVLSGYLISGSVFRMFARGQWSWRSYLTHRFVRLWIVLLPGLALAALWDFIGMQLRRAPAVLLYAGESGDHLVGSVPATFHLSTWLGNLVFLQGIVVPVFGTDGPLWSLANEFWYYLLFPLALIAIRRGSKGWVRVGCALALAGIAAGLTRSILLLLPVWLLGTLLAKLKAPRLEGGWRVAATVVYVPLIFAFAKQQALSVVPADLLFGLVTFAFLYVLLSARALADDGSFATHAWRTLARFSYTLYVVHLPLLVLFAGLLLGFSRWTPDGAHIALGLGLLAVIVAYALGLAAVTEFRTDGVRRWVERHLPGAGAAR